MSLSTDTSVCNNEDGTPGTPSVRPPSEEPLEIAVANDSWEQGQEQIRLIRSIRTYVACAFWFGVASAVIILFITLPRL